MNEELNALKTKVDEAAIAVEAARNSGSDAAVITATSAFDEARAIYLQSQMRARRMDAASAPKAQARPQRPVTTQRR